jgi:hypothetical protein
MLSETHDTPVRPSAPGRIPDWVLASSHVSLVWLVLFAAILGWLLGLVASVTAHWHTPAPRRGGASS